MRHSQENNRLSVPDSSKDALKPAQRRIFETWEQGFEAHAAGLSLEASPSPNQKVREVWQEGWRASATLERMKAGRVFLS